MGKKGVGMRWGRRDGAQRKGGREESGGRERRRMERHKTKGELRSEWKQTKGGGNVGLQDERDGEATSSSPVPPLPPPVRMYLLRVCFLAR